MGKVLKLAVIILVLVPILPARAQRPPAAFFTGVDPNTVRFQPVDTSRAMRPGNLNSAFRPPPSPSKFSLGSLFPKLAMPSWPPRIASTPIQTGPNPFQPNPILGQNPFRPATKK